MENQEINYISIVDIVEKLRRHKVILFMSISVSIFLVLVYNHLATPTYRASTLVSFERVSQDNMLYFDFAGSKYLANFVANRAKEIKTRTFAQNVYEDLPDSLAQLMLESTGKQSGRIEKVKMWFISQLSSFSLRQSSDALSENLYNEISVIDKIQSNITVKYNENTSNILTISYDSENPDLAQTIANLITGVLQKSNLKFRRQEYSTLREFVEQQIALVEEKLKNSEAALREFKSAANITSVEDESREIHRRITQAEVLYIDTQTDKGAKKRRLKLLERR